MLDFIKSLFNKKKKHFTDDVFLRIRNNSPICRFIVEISVDRDSENYKNLKSLLGPDNTVNLFNLATDIICPDYIIKSEDIISNILSYPVSSDRNEEIIRFKENVKKYKEFEEILNSSNEILVRFGFKYFIQPPYPLRDSDYIDKNHIYYDLIINNKENKINKISKELICLRFEKATMTMLHEVGSYTKQFNTYEEFYDDIIKVIKIKQIV